MSRALWFYITILHLKPLSRKLTDCSEVLRKTPGWVANSPQATFNTLHKFVEGDVQVVIADIDRVILTTIAIAHLFALSVKRTDERLRCNHIGSFQLTGEVDAEEVDRQEEETMYGT